MANPPSPEAVLSRLARFREAHALSWHPLPGGRSNESWRVCADGENYVLRISSGRLPPPVADARREFRIQRAAAAAGIAPEPVCREPEAGVLVSRYAEGAVLTGAEISGFDTLAEIAALLRRVRKLPDPGGHYTPAGAGEAYLAAVGDPALRRRGAGLVAELGSLPAPAERGVCHMDPVAGNLIRTGRGLELLDWEFAVVGDPLFDVAAVVAYHDLGEAASAHLLEAWAEGAADDALRRRLAHLVRAHDALHWLWLVAAGGHPAAERLALEHRLDRTARDRDR